MDPPNFRKWEAVNQVSDTFLRTNDKSQLSTGDRKYYFLAYFTTV